jgi:hypothetical protein
MGRMNLVPSLTYKDDSSLSVTVRSPIVQNVSQSQLLYSCAEHFALANHTYTQFSSRMNQRLRG